MQNTFIYLHYTLPTDAVLYRPTFNDHVRLDITLDDANKNYSIKQLNRICIANSHLQRIVFNYTQTFERTTVNYGNITTISLI